MSEIEPAIIPDYLWYHQKKVVLRALSFGQPYFAFFLGVGTGKTLTTVTVLRNIFYHHKRPLKTIIFCPAIVVSNWAREIDKFSKMGPLVEPLVGTGKKRIETLLKSEKKIFVTNYEALDIEGLFWEKKGKTRVLVNHGFECLVLDESHRCKNPSAKRTKMMIRMADKIYYRYLLTGTPILNSAKDIWAQARILDRGETFGQNFYSFQTKYFVDKNAGMPSQKHFPDWVFRPGAEKTLNHKIGLISERVKKEECLDLPPLTQKRVFCEMSPVQKKAYKSMKDHFIAYIRDEACVATMALTKALRLLQIVSGHAMTEEGEAIPFNDNPRMKALGDLLEDIPDKTVIWACFKHNYSQIAKVCEKAGKSFTFLTGEQSAKQKNAAVDEFTKGDIEILIANPSAGGTGVNLIEAPVAIWYSRSYNLGDRVQALARNHRGGSEMHDKITSIDLVVPGSIEESVLEALDNKENLAESILEMRNI